MTTSRSLAIAAILLGSTAVAFSQEAGIAPNGANLPPQSAFGPNGYRDGYGYGYPSYAGQYFVQLWDPTVFFPSKPTVRAQDSGSGQ
jgi:hypothetical protein